MTTLTLCWTLLFSDCDVTNEEAGDSALATPVDKEDKFLEESPVRSEVEHVIKDDASNNLGEI